MQEHPRPARHAPPNDRALTGLELIAGAAVLLLLASYLVFSVLHVPPPPPRHVGLLPVAMQGSADQLNVYGSVAGFSAENGMFGTVAVVWAHPSPDRLGGVGMTLSLFTGGGQGVDMARTHVLWNDRAGTSAIPLTRDPTVICPNWTIVSRYNIDPGKQADEDDILEPGELFDVLICPGSVYAPYEEFIVEFDPPGSGPHFPVKCSVPYPITRTMRL